MHPKILACHAAPAPHAYSTAEIIPYVREWLEPRDPRLWERAQRIMSSVQIEQRAGVLPIEEIFAPRTFEEKNASYIEASIELAAQAFEGALARAGVDAQDIDFIITSSCTGFMIPSVDAHLANRFRMKRHLQRLPVIQMGCAGGTAALMYACDYLRAHPGHRVAVVAVELPSLTLQLDDLSMSNVVSSALFADGAACVILGDGAEVRPALVDQQMVHIPDSTTAMGFKLTNSGLQIVLSREVPDVIADNIDDILFPFLQRNELAIEQIDHMIFHPGSIKILSRTEALLAPHGKQLDDSKAVLAQHGNMSSATVLFILARFLDRELPAGDRGIMLSFGPGFMGHTLLLEWR